jgi:hypothetical protein
MRLTGWKSGSNSRLNREDSMTFYQIFTAKFPNVLKIICGSLAVMLISCSNTSETGNKDFTLSVSAGDVDRSETIVSFELSDSLKEGVYEMENQNSGIVYVQVDDNNKGWFIIRNLPAETTETFSFSAEPIFVDSELTNVSKSVDENTISFRAGDKQIFNYYYKDNNPPAELDERYERGGYIHPVYSPNGVRLTNHLNTNLHPHHLGIWSAWTRTEFEGRNPDFWNFHDNTGNVESADTLYAAWEGPVYGGFRAKHFYIDLTSSEPVTALDEHWETRVYPVFGSGKYLIFDLIIQQNVRSDTPLILKEYHYGGLGFRGHEDWDNPDLITFLTSEGAGREGNATRARWTHIGGSSNGELAGITIMDHPENLRHPQPVRIHPEMAFFNYAPEQLGEFSIKPDSTYTAKYRFVTYDGNPEPDELNSLWNDYANSPEVSIQN